ncbi:MAG TPA: LysM peptidoglycan-binding domain-containing protein [Patescibacteria group bacterium]|nr:LysM peptidoglycan-binding domain-containing protein [Patescibacteria group bacterium]
MTGQHKKFELSPRLKLGVGRTYSQNQILKVAAFICLALAVGLAANAVRLLAGKGAPPQNNPQVLGASDIKPQASSTAPNSIELIDYTVVKGDTLFNISQKFNISWTTLATLNNLKSPFYLKPGQIIKVPKQ